MGRKSIIITTILILFQALQLSAQTNTDFWITESIVKARAPKRLRTFAPFWGVPEPMSGQKQTPLSSGDSRYKAEKLIPESVNIVEMKSGYNLFPKLPASIQELVEEMTTYELFCPFQEVEEGLIEMLEVEFENGSEGVEQSVE